MELFVLFLLSGVGTLCLWIGWQIWKHERISLIHDYHYTKVKNKDKKLYTEMIGKSTLILGIGLITTGIICFFTQTAFGWIAFIACMIVSIFMYITAQKKYNGGIF